jgi:Fe-S-cluster-containing dehydrogenase component/CRP-like cAMP-binding protein
MSSTEAHGTVTASPQSDSPSADARIQRPTRWDVPFSSEMTSQEVERLLRILPFADMDPSRFPATCSLRDILLNDTRVQRYQQGDIIVREGDYGASAFLVLRGSVQVFIDSLPRAALGRRETPRGRWWKAISQLWSGSAFPEVRRFGELHDGSQVGLRGASEETRIFLQDLPHILNEYQGATLQAGEIFGEVAAMARSPRGATVAAKEDCALLEIRWQGLRDLMRRAPEWKAHVEQLYRRNSLEAHLRETPLLRQLSVDQLNEVMSATEFESYGEFEWHSKFQAVQQSSPSERLEIEPVIGREGEVPHGLVLIRSGFARLSQQYGDGHQTLAYHGKGRMYGLEEIVEGWQNQTPTPLRYSLRAVGYVDILRIPTATVQQYVLPTLSRKQIQQLRQVFAEPTPTQGRFTRIGANHGKNDAKIETGLLEFIVENRFMNGAQAMMIDLERCTRCDDCVRACAATHDNNPRFIREGMRYDRYMFAHACMHCVDPVCMIGCPTGAIARDEVTGNVVINDRTCIGCATCANSCPYENIRMVEIRDDQGVFVADSETGQAIIKATKCDLCSDQWGGPACQRACPHDALIRMDMTNLPALAKWLQR